MQNQVFLNWKDENGSPGPGSLVARARRTRKKLKLIDHQMIVSAGDAEFKTKTPVGIGRFLAQEIIRADKIEKQIQQDVHGASFATLKENEVSNAMLADISTRRSDAFHRFTVVGRADCLPTPVNLQRWRHDRTELPTY
jgi:hypothetical protein